MSGTNVISADEIRILRYVIDIFVETGEPVSSRMIKSHFGLEESTANIRKILHRLEALGYLYKPHVSAGRVPSDSGYRLYVDGIRALGPPSRALAERIRTKIGQDWRDVRELMAATSMLLSDVTDYMGITMGVVQAHRVVERFEIVLLEGRAGIVILTLAPGDARKVYVRFEREYPPYVVESAGRMINERIAGHELEQAPERLESFLRESAGIEREIASTVSREAAFLFDSPYDLEYSYRGIERRGDSLELSNPRILQNLVRLMGERNIMLGVLKNRFESDVSVTIGRENRMRELEDFAIVTRRFRTADCEGILGVLGPMRMSYRLVLSLLGTTAEELAHIQIGE
jgi:heat-inducible transcriptional repressor